MKKTRRTRSSEVRVAVPAQKLDFVPSYKVYEKLARFMNDRAKIYGRKKTGLSAKDQKKITREIKRARHLGLLPFSPRV
jgi:small subunit ribosomal protein S18